MTATVRGGAIGVNRIDGPLSQIVLIGRALAPVALDRIQAVERRNPAEAIEQLARLGGAATAALAVRPRPDQAARVFNAVRLACQDQAAGAPARAPAPGPIYVARPALPAAPARRQMVR